MQLNTTTLQTSKVRQYNKAANIGISIANVGHLPSLPSHLQAEAVTLAHVAAKYGFGFSKELRVLIGLYVKEF